MEQPSDETTERDLADRAAILRAGLALIGKSQTGPVSVQQILTKAGLSTRAFYRHFKSKDDMIVEMVRIGSQRVTAELAESVSHAATPIEAITIWIERQLWVPYDPAKAERLTILNSPEARSAIGFEEALYMATQQRIGLLTDLVARGMADGSFPKATDAALDAQAVASLVVAPIRAKLAGDDSVSFEPMVAHLTAFALRALGAQ